MLKQLKRQYHNIFKINAASFFPLVRNTLMFPFRWYFNWDTVPVNIAWDITYRCNLDCGYCLYAKSRRLDIENELSLEDMVIFIEKVAKYKPSFYLAGGEPLLRMDLEEIVSAIHSRGMRVGINTNAMLLTKERLLKLEKAGLDYIIFSLDMNQSATDSVRGEGVYKKTTEAIKITKETKIKASINCVITESNYQYLEQFLNLVEYLKIDALKLSYIYFNSKEEAANHLEECQARLRIELKPDYLEKEKLMLGEKIADKIGSLMPRIKKMKIPVSFNPNLNRQEIINWFDGSKFLNRKCLYTFNVVILSPRGDIYPCHFINKTVGNIMEGDFTKMYNNRFYKLLRREVRKSLFPGCVRCNKL